MVDKHYAPPGFVAAVSTSGCSGCSFYKDKCTYSLLNEITCFKTRRPDNVSVIFIEEEK